MKCSILLFLFISATVNLSAQQINNLTLKDSNSGKEVSLSDYNDSKALVVIFTSNVCPYSVYYEGRVTQLVADYSSKGIQFILINSHLEGKESLEEMANKISTWGLGVPYLSDKDQTALTAFGARKSPEVFVLKKKSSSFDIYYKGAIDNNPQVATDVKSQYLKQNLDNLLSGKSAISGGRPTGCMIKKN